MLKGEVFHPGTKISLNFTFGIFIGVIQKNNQTQLTSEVLHIIFLTVKASVLYMLSNYNLHFKSVTYVAT